MPKTAKIINDKPKVLQTAQATVQFSGATLDEVKLIQGHFSPLLVPKDSEIQAIKIENGYIYKFDVLRHGCKSANADDINTQLASATMNAGLPHVKANVFGKAFILQTL